MKLLPERAESLQEQWFAILRELHAFAGAAALEKALEPLVLSRHHWHVIDVWSHPLVAPREPMAWYVRMRFHDTTQEHIEYITADEIFAYRLKVAHARDNEKEMMLH